VVIYAAQGDPSRSMALLWGTPEPEPRTAPGPRPGLSVDAIVDAAIAVADADGMAGLSMRTVGERLGRTGMALYTYVPGKSELLDLMYDRIHGELPTRYDASAGWRPALLSWADDLWEFYLRHPWVLQVSQARPVLGPNEYAVLETLAGILLPSGLDARMLRRVVGALFAVMRSTAQTVSEARHAAAATGVSDDDWWYARSARLIEVASDFAERFPNVTRLERAAAFRLDDESVPYLEQEASEAFRAGLGVLLDGIEATAKRATPDHEPGV
jgi:AcrR family transcriptional regulator